jgi:hypothetical protein
VFNQKRGESAMSKPSLRPTRQARKEHTAQLQAAQRELHRRQAEAGLSQPTPASANVSNRLSSWKTEEEEKAGREEAAGAQLRVWRALVDKLLADLAKIPDVRQPKKLKHKLTVLLLHGLLGFVFRMASRREVNRTVSRPVFFATLRELFPELESLAHTDTLNRVLAKLDVVQLETAHVEMLRRLIRNKKFRRYLIDKCHPIAIDGTQKLVRDGQWWDEQWLERRHESTEDGEGAEGERVQQYVYVLEANLAFHNGLTIPLLSEFLSYGDGDPDEHQKPDEHKQDCETKAFKRLAARLKKYFPRLPVMVLLDGLYPNGPVMEQCRDYGWQHMIVLPDKCLPTVWREVEALRPLQRHHQHRRIWRGRRQHFWWVNAIRYEYDNDRKHVPVHVVVCEESWEEVDSDTAEIVTKSSRHVWLSSEPLRWNTVHERCNLGGRWRWQGIEDGIQTEKRRGYCYEHPFSYNWNAMKGYHYLMRLAHAMNALAQYTKRVAWQVRALGVGAFLTLVRETCANRWLSPAWCRALLATPFQLRFE